MKQTNTPFKVLIVDDNPVTIDLLRHYMAEEAYHISQVENGEKAIPLAIQLRPDIILLDVMMPGIDGYETCRRLKFNRDTAVIPVIFVTAKIAPEDISKGFAVGASDYIAKPIQQAEVLARVANQLKLTQQIKMERDLVLKSQKMSYLGSFVSSIAHEISTPLGTLNTALSYTTEQINQIQKAFTEKTLKPAKLATFLANLTEALTISQSNIENASRILHSFKLVAVDQCRYTVSEFNLREYIENILLSLKPNLKKTSHQVNTSIPPQINIHSYPGAISQIITNLINNSLIHAYDEEQSGTISITATELDQWTQIVYQDDGRGIPSDCLNKVFEPYYTTNASNGGSGLGMGIIKRLVEHDLEGAIDMSSKEGKGIKVIINFPSIKPSTDEQTHTRYR